MANDIFDTLANGKKNWLEGAYTHTQIQQANLPDPAWFVPTLIPNPGLVAITGRPGSFKTFFTQWLALRLSAHLPLFDTWDTEPPFNKSQVPTEPINVCFIEEEMNARQVKQRANDMRTFGDHTNFHWLISSGFSLKEKTKLAELKHFVESKNIKLLIFDPFTSVAGMKDENSNAEAREVMDMIRHEFVDSAHGATVIFIHHPSKSIGGEDNIRGAGDILGKCDMHFVLEKRGEEPTTTIDVKCKKSRYLWPQDFSCEMVSNMHDLGRLEWQYRGSLRDRFVGETEDAKENILTALRGNVDGIKKADVFFAVNASANDMTYKRAWDSLLANKKITKVGAYHFRSIP